MSDSQGSTANSSFFDGQISATSPTYFDLVQLTAALKAATDALSGAITPLETVLASGPLRPLGFAGVGEKSYDITVSEDLALTMAPSSVKSILRMNVTLRNPLGFHVSLPENVRYASRQAPLVSNVAGALSFFQFLSLGDGITVLCL